jgi:hypothetical protein
MLRPQKAVQWIDHPDVSPPEYFQSSNRSVHTNIGNDNHVTTLPNEKRSGPRVCALVWWM